MVYDVKEGVRELVTRIWKESAAQRTRGTSILVGNFLYRDTAVGSAFSALLRKEIESALRRKGFTVADRDSLRLATSESVFCISQIVDPSVGVPAGALDGVDYVLKGRFDQQDEGGNVTLRVEFWGLRRADVVASASVAVQPPHVPIAPHEVAATQMMLERIRGISGRLGLRGDFNTRVCVKQAKDVYSSGENVVICIWADRDCYLSLFNIRSDSSAVLLFPNAVDRNNRIADGEVHEVGGRPDLRIVVQPPFGTESVLAIASTQPVRITSDSVAATRPGVRFRSIEGGIGAIERSVGGVTSSLKHRPECKISAAYCVLTTVPRLPGPHRAPP